MPSHLQLSPADNILVLTRNLEAGAVIETAEGSQVLKVSLPLGHKVAARKIQQGEKILKYGVPIGSATIDIAPGEHVHLHNMKSDYLPTFTLDEEHGFHHPV